MLYTYLKQNFEANEPILMSEISLPVSNNNLRQMFKKLCDAGKICRFDKGVYYLTKEVELKGGILLSTDSVINYKYIERNNNIFGYYSGNTFANLIGVTTQVPYVKEIVSNETSAICRKIKINGRSVIIRKPKTIINNDNYLVLQLLDFLKDYQLYKDYENDDNICKIRKYIKKCNITKKQVDKYINLYPEKIYKNIYEMELYNVFA